MEVLRDADWDAQLTNEQAALMAEASRELTASVDEAVTELTQEKRQGQAE